MPWSNKVRTHCTKCKRTNLTPEDFPQSTKGYAYGWCLLCEAARVAQYRAQIASDPAALARHRRKERERMRQRRRMEQVQKMAVRG